MASFYCQELIRNSKLLCESYIGEIISKAEKKETTENIKIKSQTIDLPNILSAKYYLEDDKKLLDLLIKNCHPILADMIN